jgi:hypothetical protein
MAGTDQFYKEASNPGVHNVKEPIIGYKKIICDCDSITSKMPAIAELLIPSGAKVVKPIIFDKYRTDKAIVKRVTPCNKNIKDENNYDIVDPNFLYNKCDCHSYHHSGYKYHIGKIHNPRHPLDTDVREDCSSGIHFFSKRSDAENYG